MQGARNVAACMLLAALAGACAGGSSPPPNAAERQAAALNQRAAQAFAREDYRRAAALYDQAMRVNAAVENTEGVAANALSLARVHQAAGEAAAAHRALDIVLEDGPPTFSATHRSEAQARKAQLFLDTGDVARAKTWSDQALASCAGCSALAAIQNLRARAALATGDHAAALDSANRALAASSVAPPHERANALRLTGEAHIARGEYQAAVTPLEQALELDRGLGLPARIYLDLMRLGQAQLGLGNRTMARDYFTRARGVSAAAGDEAGARAAGRAMEGL